MHLISLTVIIAILFCVPAFVSEQFAVVTCGPRCVDVESGAPDMDVGPEVPGQWLIWGLGDLVRQSGDALHTAAVRHEVHADTPLPQRRQDLLHSILQLYK